MLTLYLNLSPDYCLSFCLQSFVSVSYVFISWGFEFIMPPLVCLNSPPSRLLVAMCVKVKMDWAGYPYFYVCFGFVEQTQGGVAVTVGSQGYEGLQPLQTQPQVSSSAKGGEKQDH